MSLLASIALHNHLKSLDLTNLRQSQGSIGCPNCNAWVSASIENCPECGYWQPGVWGFHRLVKSLDSNDFGNFFAITCGILLALCLIADPSGINLRPSFSFLSPSTRSVLLMGACGSYPVFDLGHWWTVFSCPFLHGGLFHIGFNLIWIYYLAPVLIDAYGFFRSFLIFMLSAVFAGLLSAWAGIYFLGGFLQGAYISIGASGGVFALFGAMIYYGQTSGRKPILQFAIQNTIISLIGAIFIARVDNWAHIGGLAFGYLLPYLPWFNWKNKPTNIHLLVALLAFFAMILSVILSYNTTMTAIEDYGKYS
ncbi:MAG: rhomboid family intramembrane serine protease [Candidatus Caenarcaniphilales bacterium]|nr:rhomboid family intramembrane serine protease [Candidatus Caenarcaniphilales bacterium]